MSSDFKRLDYRWRLEDELDFRALTLQERVSRLEELISRIERNVIVLGGSVAVGYGNVVSQVASEFRDCDGEPLLKAKDGNYRALFEEFFRLFGGEAVIVAWNSGGERVGAFGIDQNGQFFVLQVNQVNGERLVFAVDGQGILIRDQNGNLGRVEVETGTGYLKFIPL